MKKLNLVKIEVWWMLEKMSGKLWEYLSDGQADCWFDPIPAFFYRKRKEAEKYYINKYNKSIYGVKL